MMIRVAVVLASFFASACASSDAGQIATDRTHQSVEIADLFENPDRWDGVSVRTQGFAELVEYGNEPVLMLHSASTTTEQFQPRCDLRDQDILVPLTRETLGLVRELKVRKGPPRLVEVVGLFATSGARFYTGYVFTEYSRAIFGADVTTIKADVCHFASRAAA